VPLNNLLVSSSRVGGSSGRRVGAESVREDETSEGVSTLISSVRVLHKVEEESVRWARKGNRASSVIGGLISTTLAKPEHEKRSAYFNR